MLEAIFTENVLTITLAGLYQWDYGQKLYIKGLELDATEQIHFSNQKEKEAIVMPLVKKGEHYICDIPNVLLEKSLDIICWIYDIGANSGETIRTVILKIEPRAKPQDFISTNPDANDILSDALDKINQNFKDNEAFKTEIKLDQDKFKNEVNKTLQDFSAKPVIPHTHDDRYYTESEINSKIITINSSISTKANQSDLNYLNTKVSRLEQKMTTTTKTITIYPSDWTDNAYTLHDSLITSTSNQSVLPPEFNDNYGEIEWYQNANFVDAGQGYGWMKLKALGDVPKYNLRIRVIFRGEK